MSWPRIATRRPRLDRLRARASTTPGRLRLIMAGLVVVAVVAGLVLSAAAGVRRDAADAVATQDEPLMVEADGLYASLSDADATAAATFLTGGVESPASRARYLTDVRRASVQLTGLARRVQDSPEAAAAVAAIAAQLPLYSGLMETARANNRQGFPVGAAYLRQASDLMRGRILPAAGRLYAVEARRLGDHERTGTAPGGLIAVLVACAVALAALVAAQVFLALRTHRVFNVPLAGATVLMVAVTVWAAIGMGSARNALAAAQRDGSDSVQVLSAARILALRAQADESLALVARGGGQRYLDDFAVVDRVLGGTRGLLAEASQLARRTRTATQAGELSAAWRDLRSAHTRVAGLEDGGRFSDAVAVAVGRGSREAAAAERLNRGFTARIDAAQQRFERSASDARSSLRGLAAGIPLLLVLIVILAVLGLQRRIDEYR